MKIGIKYCGGCNPVFDRAARVEKFKRDNRGHDYVSYPSETSADYWLAVCGCSRICADTSMLDARREIFLLWTEADFQRAQKTIREASQSRAERDVRLVAVGEIAEMTRTITRADAQKFGELTGDENSIHSDVDTAHALGFGDTPVHGMLLDSLVSSLMGTRLPGSGTIFASHDTRFIRPVFPGETVTVSVEITAIEDQGDMFAATLRGVVKNASGERVLTSHCVQMLKKTFFGVKAGEGH